MPGTDEEWDELFETTFKKKCFCFSLKKIQTFQPVCLKKLGTITHI